MFFKKLLVSTDFNKLNLDFYQKIGENFALTREIPWVGWEKLWLELENNIWQESLNSENYLNYENKKSFHILDLGCGNGRFASFMQQKLLPEKNWEFVYFGLDFSSILLDKAKEKLELEKISKALLIQLDLLDKTKNNWEDLQNLFDTKPPFKKNLKNKIFWQSSNFDINNFKIDNTKKIITLFGVMHHFSSYQIRLEFLQNISKLLKVSDIFVFTTWNFLKDPRLQKKLKRDLKDIKLNQNDYFLGWKENQEIKRYCHYYEDDEVLELLKNSNLRLIKKFLADGKTGLLNTYWVIKSV